MENKYVEEEISLKELIMHLIEHKRIIVLITAIAIILGGLYAFLIADKVYEASIDGTIIISESASTKYGVFVFPSIFKDDYLNVITTEEVLKKVIKNLDLELTTQSLRNKLTVVSQKDSSTFVVSIKDSSSERATDILNEISIVFKHALNMKYKKLAVESFERDYFVQIKSIDEMLEKQAATLKGYKAQLEMIQPTITLKKLVTTDPSLAAQIARDRGLSIESLSDEMMLEEISNPNYEQLEDMVIKTESAIIDLQTSLDQKSKLYEELLSERADINTYYANGGNEPSDNGALEFMTSRITISPYVTASEDPIAPRKSLILAISMVLGLMIGVFVAFFKAYWHNN